MRHRSHDHQFGRKPGPRKALIRGLVESLVEHGRIKTTLPRAKELRRHVERAITLGKKGQLATRRVLLSRYPNKQTVKTIVDDLATRFKERPGGYTRIIKLGSRPGDQAEMAFIEFVDYKFKDKSVEVVDASGKVEVKARDIAKKAEKKRKRLRKLQSEARKVSRGS